MKHKNILDKSEQYIENTLEKGEYLIARDQRVRKKMFQEAAKHFNELKTAKRITIRVNKEDLIKVKAKAKQNQIPYQRLINTLIHKFAEGEVKITL